MVEEQEINETLKSLIEKGLISYKVYESGEKYYFITDEGRNVLQEIKEAFKETEEE